MLMFNCSTSPCWITRKLLTITRRSKDMAKIVLTTNLRTTKAIQLKNVDLKMNVKSVMSWTILYKKNTNNCVYLYSCLQGSDNKLLIQTYGN